MIGRFLLCSIAVVASQGAAMAQSATPAEAPTAAPEASSSSPLQDIVVTAQRRSENSQKVPIAITAVSAAELKAQGIATTADLAKVTPGLTIANTAGLVRPSQRGVTTTSAGPGIENSVATYIDGVYIASIASSLMSFGGVERVEVLRGPQGTLFGRNATGGLIQVVTKDLGSRLEGEASATYGNYDTIQGSAYVAGPLSDSLGVSLAISGAHEGKGYGVNFATGNDVYRTDRDIAVRNKWMLKVGDLTTLRLSLDYANSASSTPSVGALRGRSAVYGPIREGSAWDIDQNRDPIHMLESGGGSLRVDQQLGDLRLVSITAFRAMNFLQQFDFDTGPKPAINIDYRDIDHQFSQELQLQSDDGPFKWVLGGYYFGSSAKYTPDIQTRGAPLTPGRTVTRSDVTAHSLAGFGQASYRFDGGTEITAGLRYTSEKRGITGTTETFDGAGNSLGLAFAPIDTSTGFSKLTWRLAISPQLSPRTLVYASYNRGFKAGSYNGQNPNLPAFQPEVLDAYKAGLKTDMLDRHLRVNLAGFYYDYSNIQVTTFVNGSSRIYNGVQARQYGLDLDVTAALDSHLTLTGSVEAIHDRFRSFPSAVISHPQASGSNVLTPGSADGNRLPYTADLTFSANARYTHEILGGAGQVNVNYQYNDGYFTEPDNVLRQSSFNMLGASIGCTSPQGYSISLWGKNLLKEEVATLLATTPDSTFAGYQPPRIYGVTLGMKV